jgi:lipoprotein-anchoring transpeptidase ErfK/SrfK
MKTAINKAVSRTQRKATLAMFAFLMAIEAAEAQQNPTSAAAATQRNVMVLVSIPDRKLAVIEDGSVTHVFPVAVGKQSTPSPTGEFAIVSRVVQPTYYHPGVVVPPGPENPLGTRWIGLSLKGFGIHGTNVPSSIGKAASHGCIRMRRADLEKLFAMLRTGDSVVIRGERDAQIAQVFGGETTTTVAEVATTSAVNSSNK